jgi:hypothetical protein
VALVPDKYFLSCNHIEIVTDIITEERYFIATLVIEKATMDRWCLEDKENVM